MLSVLMPRAWAQNFESVSPTGQTLYYQLENGGAVLTGHYGDIGGALTVPDSVTYEGVAYPVTTISGWSFNNTGITSLTVGASVSWIQEAAFQSCQSLTSVTLPATVTQVDYIAFNDCPALTQVNYGGTLVQWMAIDFGWYGNPLAYGHHLFIDGQEVTNLVIPEGVTIVKSNAFQGCTGLETVTFPSTLDSVGNSAFVDCSNLARVYCSSLADWCHIGFADEQSNPVYWSRKLYVGNSRVQNTLTIPEGVTEIKPYAFFRLSNVYTVEMPEGLQRIGHRAFWEWEWNVDYTVPSTVTSIGEYALHGNGTVYYNAVNCNVARYETWNAGAVALPHVGRMIVGEGVQRIPRYLLPYDDYLSVLKLMGSTPPEVANFAFDNMRSRVNIQVPCGLTATYRAAAGWDELTENTFVEVPPYTLRLVNSEHGWASINRDATCTLPAIIDAGANENWHFIRWSDGVTNSYREVFLTQDTVLWPVFGPDHYDTLENGLVLFYRPNATGLTLERVIGTITGAFVIPDSVMYDGAMMPVTEIRCGDLNEQRNMTSVTLPKNLKYVTGFYECTGLTRVDFGGTLEQWCNIQFENWHSNPTRYAHHLYIGGEEVLNPVIPEGVTAIKYIAFVGLNAMATITLPASLDTVAEEAFNDCGGLVRVNYNGTLSDWCRIGFVNNPLEYAHHLYIGGSEVTDIIIPEGVTVIKNSAFRGLNGTRTVVLPEGLQYIGRSAFIDLWPEDGFTIPSTVTYIGEGAIRGDKIYYNATNCTVFENNAFYEGGNIEVGENVQAMPTNLFSDRIGYLKMQGNPPTVAQYALERLRSDCQVKVPCGMLATYRAAAEWSAVPNMSETPMYEITFGEAEHGRAYVQTEATCTMPAKVSAESYAYYHFVQWADGNTANPRNITLTQDTMLTPVFAIDTYTVNVAVRDSVQGWVTGSQQVLALDTITIAAHANPGYRFTRWDDWDEGWEDSVRTLVVYGNREYYPVFEAINICDTLANGYVFCYTYRNGGMGLYSVSDDISGEVVIPDSVTYEGTKYPVTSIYSWVFGEKQGVTVVTLPATLRLINNEAFYNMQGLTRVNYNGTIAQWCGIDFENYWSNPVVNNNVRRLYIGGTEVVDLVIPEGVTSISRNAFREFNYIATVTLPSTLDTVGYDAFEGCGNLLRITYNGTLAQWCGIGFYEEWGSNPLVHCNKLYIGGSRVTSLVIPEGVTVIKPCAFQGLNEITKVDLPEGLVRIGRYAFENMWGTVFTIPSTVTYIGEYAIRGNTVYYNAANCTQYSNNAIPDANTIVVGENVQSLSPYLFTGNISIMRMQGNPPTVASYAFDRLWEGAQIQVKCGKLSLYQQDAVWSSWPNLMETNTYAVKFGHSDNGSAWIQNQATCVSNAQIYAGANDHYHFTQWTDGNTDNPREVVLTQDTMFTPEFALNTYYVVPVVCNEWNERGNVTGGDTVLAGATVTITATPNPGYYFSGWSDGDGQAVRTFEVWGNNELCANFELMQFVDGQLYYRYAPGRGMVVSGHNGDISGDLVIPDTVTFDDNRYPVVGIDSWSLAQQFNMTSVTLPATLDTIRYDAFYDESNLTAVNYTGTLAQWCQIYFENAWSNPTQSAHRLYIGNDEVINPIISEGVTSIGQYAFVNCTELANVTLPSTLDTIGYGAFENCNALGRTRFTGSIAQWCNVGFGGASANPIHRSRNFFLGSSKVTDLVVPAGVSVIKDYAFYGCNSLISVSFGDDVRRIGQFAFESCEYLNTINFSPYITDIDFCAFRYCGNMRMFDLPDSLHTIGSYAFWDCWNASVVIPANVTYVANEALHIGGQLYYNAVNCTQLSNNAFPYVGTITVGEGVQVIPYGLITNNLQVLRMKCVPPTVENWALDRLRSDARVEVACGLLPLYQANDEWNQVPQLQETNTYTLSFASTEHGYVDVWDWATCTTPARFVANRNEGWHFMRWSDGNTDNPRELMLTQDTLLTPVFVQDLYDTLPDNTIFYYYYYNAGMTLGGVNGTLNGNVVIPDSVMYEGEMLPVTKIDGWVFNDQPNMTEISLPASLSWIGSGCFGQGVRTVFRGTVGQWCAIRFDDSGSQPARNSSLYIGGQEVINLIVPEGVTSIGQWAFYAHENMVSVTLPSTLDTIEYGVFEGCSNLRRTIFNGTVADWCDLGMADYWTSSPIDRSRNLYIGGAPVVDLVIPEGVTVVKPGVFAHLSTLRSVSLPEGLLSLGSYAFYDCNWGLEVTIPSTVVRIGHAAVMSNNILYFNATNCTFMDAGALSDFNTIVVGENVQSLPINLFTGNLWTLKMQGNPPTVDPFAFDRMPEGSQVQVRCGMLSQYQSDPVWSTANLVETNTYALKFGGAEHGHVDVWQNATCSTPAQVYASNDSYYHFIGWSDGVTDNPRTITLTQDTILTPVFAIDTYTVAVGLYDTLQGWVAVNGQQVVNVLALDTLTLEAHAYPGFTFLRWEDWDYNNYNDSVRTVVATYSRIFYPQFEPFNFCDTTAGIITCYRYNGRGMTLQSVNGTINGIYAIPDSVEYEGMLFPVTEIDGWGTFSGQNNMTWITLPKGLTRVRCDAFSGCDNLTRVIWNGSMEQWCNIDFECGSSNPICYARHLFMNGVEVINPVIPEGITELKRNVFYNLSSIASITLPSTLDTIGDAAFEGCNGLLRTIYNGTVEQWCHIGFANGWNAQPITYSRNLYIGGEVVNNLEIPNSITAIKPYAFERLSTLHSLQLPEGLLSIGHEAFWECNWSLEVTIPSTVTRIEENAIMSNNTLFYNAVNCEYVANNALPYFTKVFVDDAVQSIPTYLITSEIQHLKMQGLPPSVTGDVLDRLNDNAQVHVPCGLLATYQNTPFWNTTNLVETNTYALKFGALEHGYASVNVEPSCTTPAEVWAWGDWKWHFTQWSDGVTDNPRTVNLTQDTILTPLFAIDTYYVVGNVWPSSEYGMVLGCDTVPADDTVTLVARANYGYHFVQWNDGVTDSVRVIPVDGNWWGDAMFERNLYNVTAKVDAATPYGVISYTLDENPLNGDSISFLREYGFMTAVTAVPQTGYHFTQWSDGVTDNPRFFVVSQDTAFTALFEINMYSIVGTASVSGGYNFDFEDANDDGGWTLVNGAYTNRWYIGTYDTNSSNRALFVSDNGYNNHYNNQNESIVWAYHPVSLLTGTYNYSFDWLNPGEAGWDFIRVALLPESVALNESAWGHYEVQGEAILLENAQQLANGYEWQQANGSVTVEGGNYKLIFYWYDDNCCGNTNAAVVDNIVFSLFNTVDTSSVVMGTVLGSDTVPYMDSVTLTAVPEYGFHFEHWNDNVTDNPRTVVATSDKVFLAVFGYDQFNVATAVDNVEHGSVTGAGNYNYLTEVTLVANPAYGYHFIRWNDNDTNNPRVFALTQDTSFSAQFARNSYTVAAQANYAERGVAAVSDTMLFYLDSVTATATANYGYHFTQWSDGVTDNPRQSAVTSDVVYTAVFDFNQYYLGLAVDNVEHGTVTGNGNYNYLADCTVTATPAYGYHFTMWSDSVTANPRTVTLTQDTSFTALFAKNNYTVTALTADEVKGSASGTATVEYLDTVTLEATANYGYHFTQWNDGVTANPRQVVATGNDSYTAQFDFNQYNVTLAVDSSIHGSVTGAGSYNYLNSVTLEATANYGYHFSQWNDGVTDNPRTITLTQDTAFTAQYAHNLYTLTVTSNDDSLGTVTGGGVYEYLDEVQLAATVVAAHHHFVMWSDGVTESVRTVTVTDDLSLTAVFAIDTHTVATAVRLGTADGVTDYNTCGTVTGAGSYPYGTMLTLEATAADGYHFAEWDNGDQTLTRVIAVTQDTLIAAVFTDDVTPSLCMVSVQDDRNVVVWTKDYEVDRYNIYRESNTSGVYAIVAVVPFDSASSWVDTTSRPASRSYRYKMTAVDVYGYESDFGDVHKTMHLTISPGMSNRTWNLVWTEYEGTEFVSYMIYRFSQSEGLEMIDQLPVGGNTTYTDEDAPGSTKYYQVAAVKSTPCSITKNESVIRSNIAVTDNVGISDVENDNFSVYNLDGKIVVEGADGMSVVVYDVTGRRIAGVNRVESSAAEFSVASGVYLVKVGETPARRVVVTR